MNRALGAFGLRLARAETPDPARRSIERHGGARGHNTVEGMDAFYADPELLTHYFTAERLGFYDRVCARIAALGLHPGTVLDAGCGSGHLLARLRRAFPAATLLGVDFSPQAVRLAASMNPDIAFETADLRALGRLGRRFDLVVCTEVLEHLDNADEALGQLAAACSPAGTLVITVPDGRRDTFAGHVNFWTPESFGREFQRWNPVVEEDGSYLFITVRPGKADGVRK